MTEMSGSYVFHTLPFVKPLKTRYLAEATEFLSSRGKTLRAGRIQLTALRIPSGALITMVAMIFPELGWALSLGASEKFRAGIEGSSANREFEINQLDCAIVSANGLVTLRDGTRLRAVELSLTRLPENLSDLEEKIIRLIVEQTGSDSCYQNLAHEIPDADPTQLPELWVLDYGRVQRITAPSFKKFCAFLRQHNLALQVSPQKYSQTLIKCGLRQHRSTPATI